MIRYNKSLLGNDLGKFPAPLLMNTVHFSMQAVLSKSITWYWSERFQPSVAMSWKDYFMIGKLIIFLSLSSLCYIYSVDFIGYHLISLVLSFLIFWCSNVVVLQLLSLLVRWLCLLIFFRLTFLSTNATDGICLSQLYRLLLGQQWILTWAMHPLFLYQSRLLQWLVVLPSLLCHQEMICHFNVLYLIKHTYLFSLLILFSLVAEFNLCFCSVNQLLQYFFFYLLLLSGESHVNLVL